MKTSPTEIDGVYHVKSEMVRDERGCVSVVTEGSMVQNPYLLSYSRSGTLRGLHYQLVPFEVNKLVRVVQGKIFDVAVDLRRFSPTFGKWVGRELDAEEGDSFFVPVGFAHGFLALSDAIVLYKLTAPHVPSAERAIYWSDPDIGVRWPIEPTSMSRRDREAPPLADAEHNFYF